MARLAGLPWIGGRPGTGDALAEVEVGPAAGKAPGVLYRYFEREEVAFEESLLAGMHLLPGLVQGHRHHGLVAKLAGAHVVLVGSGFDVDVVEHAAGEPGGAASGIGAAGL